MLKKTVTIAAVAALVMAGALIAVGQTGQATACDGKTETASTGSSCTSATKTASAGSSCTSTTKTASAAKVSSCTGAASASSCSKTAQAQSSCCAKQAKTAHYDQVKKAADQIPNRVNSRVVLTGTYTCGSCDLGMTDTCQAFLKTADGKLYPMEHSSKVKSMKGCGTKNFEVTARVTKQGGSKYLDVTNYTEI
jgi:hypothetical protein